MRKIVIIGIPIGSLVFGALLGYFILGRFPKTRKPENAALEKIAELKETVRGLMEVQEKTLEVQTKEMAEEIKRWKELEAKIEESRKELLAEIRKEREKLAAEISEKLAEDSKRREEFLTEIEARLQERPKIVYVSGYPSYWYWGPWFFRGRVVYLYPIDCYYSGYHPYYYYYSCFPFVILIFPLRTWCYYNDPPDPSDCNCTQIAIATSSSQGRWVDNPQVADKNYRTPKAKPPVYQKKSGFSERDRNLDIKKSYSRKREVDRLPIREVRTKKIAVQKQVRDYRYKRVKIVKPPQRSSDIRISKRTATKRTARRMVSSRNRFTPKRTRTLGTKQLPKWR